MNLKLDKSIKYILSCSGGVDSMVLLDYLIKNKYSIVCVNFNHMKREQSFLEHKLIKEVCEQNGIVYEYFELNLVESNFQENARIERHKILISISDKYQTNYILTAHHKDDLMETMLMKIIRGTSLVGASGFKEESLFKGKYFIKPLINQSKEDLYNYASINEIKYYEDHTNKENDYLRNRIRNNVIPLLKKENDVLNHFTNLSKQLFNASSYIRESTLSFLSNENEFSIKEFKLLHRAVKEDIISYIFEINNQKINYNKLISTINQIENNKPNSKIFLSNDCYILKVYDNLYYKNVVPNNPNKKNPYLTISHKKSDINEGFIELCYNKLDFPISCRYRKNGDVIKFPFGTKKLKDFFIDKKIPLQKRDELILIVDANDEIICIPNLYINHTLGNQNKIYLLIKE